MFRSATRHAAPLDLLCACLLAGHRGQRLDPTAAAALFDPATDLVGLARLAGRHCVTPMLAAGTADPGLRRRMPEDFGLYLDFMHAENRRRNTALSRQLEEIAFCLNQLGIEPVLLKGAIRLVDGLYPDPGWRFMRDLDLLIPRHRWPDALARLKAAGYRFTRDVTGWPADHRHLPPLGRDGEPAVVELHAELLPAWQELCPTARVLAGSRSLDLETARVRLPDTADQLAHLLGHDRFDGYLRRSGMFLLRSVFEAALLSRDAAAVNRLFARAARVGVAGPLRVRLGLATRLFPDYARCLPAAPAAERLQTQAIIALERFDENGRWRRLFWFARLRLGKLLRLRAERAHLASNILTLEYGQRGIARLRRLWTID